MMEKITRKSLLYKTGVEYGDYTLNHVLGCAHGCKYPCYAMQMAKRFGKVKSYVEWCEPKLVENAIEILDKEIPRLKEKIQFVNLCFTTDPFMQGYEEVTKMSMEIIKKLNDNDIKCSILTKGLLPRKLKDYKDNQYGITLVSLDEHFRESFEPNTSSFNERIDALRYLHNEGCYTWVSIEPYPTPNVVEQNLNELLNAVSFVDKIIFGRMHYNKVVGEYEGYKKYYNDCANKVIKYCNNNDIDYHIKKGTITGEQ